ncbi:MAG: energy transducer TonB [Bacteroidetes bacterium]|nr:energy transducer TonB [Bacteroidota bacterium]
MQKLRGDIRLTVDTSGAVTDCVFNTNLTKDEINKMDYYLRHVTNLPVVKDSSNKIQRIMNLQLTTIIDTQKNNTYVVNYKISNPDPLLPAEELSDTISTEKDVQVEAQFPGGKKVWQKYLERNIQATLPAIYGAPKDVYTVILSFVVEEDGKISNLKIINNPGYGTVLEAARVVMSGPKWIPAIKDGRNVKFRVLQSISFEVSQ